MLAVLAFLIQVLAFEPESWGELKRAVDACKTKADHARKTDNPETFVHMRDYCNNSAPQQQGAQIISEMIERLAGPTILARKMDGISKLNVVEYGCATGNPRPLSKIKQAAGPSLTSSVIRLPCASLRGGRRAWLQTAPSPEGAGGSGSWG